MPPVVRWSDRMAGNCKMCDQHNLTGVVLDAGPKAYWPLLDIAGAVASRDRLAPELATGQIQADSRNDMRKGQTRLLATPLAAFAGKDSSYPKRPGRRERNAKETRLRLSTAALQLFADRGFQSVTVEDITRAADVGKGTFFNYFDCKEHVLAAIPELQFRHVAEAVEAAYTGKQSIQSILRRMFHSLSKELGHSPQWARSVAASFLADDFVREIVRHQMSEGRSAAATVIAEGQRRGEIDPNIDSTNVALHIQEVLLGTVLLWSLQGKPKLTIWVESSFWLFWRSVAAKNLEHKP